MGISCQSIFLTMRLLVASSKTTPSWVEATSSSISSFGFPSSWLPWELRTLMMNLWERSEVLCSYGFLVE